MAERTRRRTKLAIGRLLARSDLGPEAIERFLARHEFPIVEGAHLTFVALADDVEGVWLRHRIQGLPEDLAMHRVDGTPLWWVTVEIPGESRMEYQFETRRHGEWQRFNDPRNPRIARSPVGDSSVCWGAGYAPPDWAFDDPDARKGTLVEHHLPSRAQRRTNHVTVYLPARYRPTSRYPLLIVHDGGDFLEFAGMKTVLDNLIHRLDMAEVVVAFTRPGDRLVEYPNNAAHARWITTELIPFLNETYPLIDEPSARCLMGSSFGAIAAFSVAYRNREAFGSLLLQSGSFVFTDIAFDHGGGPAFDPVVKFVNRYRLRPRAVADRMFVSCGIYEPLIVQNRSMLEVWRETGMDVHYVESRDGHNWESWRDRLRDGLSWIFPGDQLFFYE
ncbi:alpha/beta hydrolase [Propionibacteriaceae bacterium Y1700]|uniref:alpha/beta hydrolase n=1 Tax=Microlunatus sp. Y1700 TaxID=3418487 RepID=UPI003DA7480A